MILLVYSTVWLPIIYIFSDKHRFKYLILYLVFYYLLGFMGFFVTASTRYIWYLASTWHEKNIINLRGVERWLAEDLLKMIEIILGFISFVIIYILYLLIITHYNFPMANKLSFWNLIFISLAFFIICFLVELKILNIFDTKLCMYRNKKLRNQKKI